MKLTVILLAICLFGIWGCGAVKNYNYRMVSKAGHVNQQIIIPIWADGEMTGEELKAIRMAMEEWNMVLNGQMVLKWEKPFRGLGEARERAEEAAKTGIGWVIMGLEEENPLLEGMVEEGDGSLAFVNGRHLMVIIKDRIGTRDLKVITMHEMGHLMGAMHVRAESLMNPLNGPNQVGCVDKITAIQVANRVGLKFNNLNYCVVPHFE